MERPKSRSYARWLPALIVAMTLVAMLMGGITLHYVETSMVAAAGESLTLAAVDIADKLDMQMAERYGDIQVLSQSVVFQGHDHAAMGQRLRSLLEAYPVYRWAGVTDAKGRVLVATDRTSKGRDMSGEPGFLAVRAERRAVVQDAAPDDEGVLAVTFVSPLHNARGAFIGTVISQVGLPVLEDAFARVVNALQAQWGSGARIEYLFLNHDGEVFVDSFLREEGQVNLKQQGVLSAQLLDAAPAGFIEEQHGRRHVDIVTGYAQTKGTENLKGLRWGVLVRVDRSDILVPIRNIMWKVGAAGIGMFLPLVAILMWSITRLTHLWGTADEERSRAQAAERKFHTLLEMAPDAIVMTDTEGKIVLTNRQVDLVFGYPPGQLIGQPIEILVPEPLRDIHRTHRARFHESPQARQMGRSLHFTGRRQDGTKFPIHTSLSHAETAEGSFAMASVRDVSQQQMEEAERERLAREIRSQYEVTLVLAESDSLVEAAPELLRAIGTGLDWSVGALWEMDHKVGALRCTKVWGCTPDSFVPFVQASLEMSLAPGVGLPGRVWTSGQAEWIPDVGQDENFPRSAMAVLNGLHAAVAFPILLEGEILGVMEFFSTTIRHPDNGTLSAMNALGIQIGAFVRRKRAQEALRESEQRLSYALDATSEGLWDWNIQTGTILFSPQWITSLGYSPDDVTPSEDFWKSIIHPDDMPRTLEALQAHFEKRTPLYQCENRLRMKSGHYRHNLDRGKVVAWDAGGHPLRMVGTDTDITERKRMEDQLIEAYAMLKQVMDNIPFYVFWKDRTSTYMGGNALFAQAAGVQDPQALIGKTDFELNWKDLAELHRADDRTVMETNTPKLNFEEPLSRPDGTVRHICTSKVPLKNQQGTVVGVLGIFEDITERKQAGEMLRKSETRTRHIIETALDAFIGMDAGGFIIDWNTQAEQMFGWPRQEAIGRHLSSTIIPPQHREAHERGLRHFLATGEGPVLNRVVELTGCHRDGHEFPVELAISTSLAIEEDYTFSAFVRDISLRKQAQQELLDAKELAETSARAKSEFLATMSHEIRTPMNGVIGMTGLLLDTDLTPEQREFAETVRRSGDHLLTVINDILDFSKIEAGKLSLEIIDFDLRTTVAESVDLLAERAASKGLHLACLFHAEVPAALCGDPGRLRQILLNLVGNAIKFTDHGEVVVSVTLLHQTETEATVRFEVQDAGIGLSPEAQGHLFQSFSQADSSTTRKFGGTGLGLAICKQLTELMGGHIGVDSRLGEGSTFWFTVQLGKQQQNAASDRAMAPQDLHRLQLCIVDDSPINRRILELHAERWGVRCLVAEDGQQALALLRKAAARGHACDLAVIDMQLPGMNGLELASAIKADPVLAPTRLVLLTSQGQRGDAKAAQAAGYAAYLSKPVQAPQLYECLTTVLKQSAEAAACEGQSVLVTRHSLAEMNAQATAKILLAEDNVVNQKVAVRMLEKLGYRVDLVANGLEVLDALARIPYTAVLMDCQMPEMDGFAATAEIRRREASGCVSSSTFQVSGSKREDSVRQPETCNLKLETRGRIPIIAMTANALQEDRDRCLAAGMDDYLSKPVQPKVLAEVLARWVGASASISDSTDDRPLQAASGGTGF